MGEKPVLVDNPNKSDSLCNYLAKMKIAILAFPGAVSSSVTGPYDILTKSNAIFKRLHPNYSGDKLEVKYVGYPIGESINNPLLSIQTGPNTDERFDLVVVSAIEPDRIQEVLETSHEMVRFIKQQYYHGAEIASVCMGAFLLASTGLLDGKRATTHWMGAESFRNMFPKVQLEDDKILIDAGRVYTSGGAFTFTNFIMYLVEKYCGHDTAIMASKTLLIDLYKDPQTSYSIFNMQKQHGDDQILKVQRALEERYSDELKMAALADEACMSQRTFLRRFKRATGNTPIEYLQRVRIEAAKKMLEARETPVDGISNAVGYEDYGSFLKLFKRYTSISPSAYRKRYADLREAELMVA